MKYALLSMDIEDWYHLDYLPQERCDSNQSLLDGIGVYAELLAEEGVPSTFFALGELASGLAPKLRDLSMAGHEIACHGWDHCRPLDMELDSFREDIKRSKGELENVLGIEILGYRAPCFSLDRPRLEILRNHGFAYDSSRIEGAKHPLYGKLDLKDFNQVHPWVFHKEGFTVFEVSTLKLGRVSVPVAGGGYIRLLPWWMMKAMLSHYLSIESLYILYIHPFELSGRPDPELPSIIRFRTRLRFSRNRFVVPKRLRHLIGMLKRKGYHFTTFSGFCMDLGLFPS